MGRVFISHSAEDLAIAMEICDAIERRNIPCWIAPRNVVPGEDFAECIDRAIETSSAFILVLSRASNDSHYVKSETDIAVDYKRPIFPVRIENVEPSKSLKLLVNRWHRIDAFGAARDSGIRMLADAVSRRVTGGTGARSAPRDKPPGGGRSSDLARPLSGSWHWPAFLGGIFWLFRSGAAGLGWAALCGLLAFMLLGTIIIGDAWASVGLFALGWLAIAAMVALRAAPLRAGRPAPAGSQGMPAIFVSAAAILLLLIGLQALDQPGQAAAADANALNVAAPAGETGPGLSSSAAGVTDQDAIAAQREQEKSDIYNAGISDTVNAILEAQASAAAANATMDGGDGTATTNGM
jgi:hypothetical protein